VTEISSFDDIVNTCRVPDLQYDEVMQ